jgi:hypothetical protein
VKGYIALAPPFGGALGALAVLTSGSVEGVLPKSILDKLTVPPGLPFTREDLLYKAAFGMAGFLMLSPTIAGFPDDPVSGRTTKQRTYIPIVMRMTSLSAAYSLKTTAQSMAVAE